MKYAFCVGVNYAGTSHALKGCLNDVDDWSKLLLGNGFTVTALKEEAATREGILGGLKALIDNLSPGDVGFFTFSGHGTWVPDVDGDEPDGRDEALVPFDIGADGKNLILDDELAALFEFIPPGAHVVFVSDCCHSGSIFRMMASGSGDRRPRFLPPSHFLDSEPVVARMTRAFGQPGKSNAPLPGVVHLSGCKDHEYSTDAKIDDRPCGALTYYATRAFSEAAVTGRTYADAFKAIRSSLPSWDYVQTPQLNAPSSLKKVPVFG